MCKCTFFMRQLVPRTFVLRQFVLRQGKMSKSSKKLVFVQTNPISLVESPFPILMYAAKNGANKDNFSNRSK